MNDEYSEVDLSVLSTARELIDSYHNHLLDANIAFVFKEAGSKIRGKYVLGSVSKFPRKFLPLFDDINYHYLIWISKTDWDYLESKIRYAIMDHLLSHCCFYDEDSYSVVYPDIQEFSGVLARHGLWNPSLLRVKSSLQHAAQLRLDGFSEGRGVLGSISAKDNNNAAD
jgi:hypothetical protein